jgi:zinc/manganese transport system substrate-binding protein
MALINTKQKGETNMKKLLICAALASMLSFTSSPAKAAVNIFACEPEWGSLANEIGGDAVSVYVATTGRQDPHQIQARPSLIARARSADLVFCTGAELEVGWMPVVLRQAANGKIQPGSQGYLEAASVVTMKEIPLHLDRAEGDIHAAGNPHIQTDPRNFLPVADLLAARLAEIDPANASVYKAHHDTFIAKWKAAIQKWETEAASLKGTPIAEQHKSWVYLNDWLGLKSLVALEPKPGVPPSSGYLSEVLAKVKGSPVKMTIRAAYEDDRPSKWLEENAGVPAVELPFTVGGSDKAKDLFGLFDDTVDQLVKGAHK